MKRRRKRRAVFSANVDVTVNVRGMDELIKVSEFLDLPDPDTTNFNKLNRCFVEQASRRGYLTTLAALAKKRVSKRQQSINRIEAELYKQYRQKYAKQKGVTETFLKRRIWRNPAYVKADSELIEAQYQHDLLKGLVQSMDDRKDALVSLGANLRKEWSQDPG